MITPNIAVVELSEWENISDEGLRQRAQKSAGGWAHFFLARVGPNEAGLLVLDLLTRPPSANVREIFVVPGYRRMGIGEGLLAHAEVVARQRALPTLHLQVHPLVEDTSRQFLTQWYRRSGFITEGGHSDKMTKTLLDLGGPKGEE